jgi:carboxypeptidase family protein
MKGKAFFRQVRFSSGRVALFALGLILVILLAASLGNAQSTGGRIRGTVTDPSGGAVVGATVTLLNEATHATHTAQAGTSGEYSFLEISVGSYEMQVTAKGFKRYTRNGISVNLNEVVSLDITLQVGGTTEVVEVTGAAPLVDTTSTQLGAVVGERAVSQLPLAQRNTYQLLQLQPGVQSQVGLDTVYGSDRAGVVSVNGGRGRDNNFTVNGGDGNDQFAGLPAIQPSPDAIEEFRVLTNTFDAEYGRNSGAVVNVVTKSGSNDVHGNVYEFFRNKNLNAKGFFDSSKLDYLQNQFGATLGGPIKKDRTFFFVTYEGDRIRRGTSSDTVTVPTLLERAGNFSEGGNGQFQGSLTSDFIATTLNNRCGLGIPLPSTQPSGDVPWSAIFPNQQIPPQCFDPTAVDLFKQFVPPANVGDSLLQTVPLGHERNNQFTVKIDHELTNNQQLSGYYYFTQHYLAKPFARFQSGGANVPDFGDLTDERIQQLNISHTWRLGSTAVNQARFTFFREGQGTFLHPQHTALVQDSCKTVPAANCFADPNNPDLGIHPELGASREGVPFVNISGGFNLGNNFEGELPQIGNTYQWSDSFSKTIGKHDLKFGGDFRSQRFDQTLFFDISGQYFYFGGGPNDPSLQVTDPNTGTTTQNLFPNYFLGLPDEYGQGSAQEERVRSKSVYLFAQDSWKIKPSLTLNYGLRWEFNSPLADAGQKVQTFRPGQADTIYPCVLKPDNPSSIFLIAQFGSTDCSLNGLGAAVFPLGLVVPGDKGVPNGLSQSYYKSFAPRIGLAWSPSAQDGILHKLFGGTGKSSIRAGFGMFYNPVEQLVLEQFSAEPPFGGSTFVFNTLFNTPFLSQDGSTSFPNPFHGILNPPRTQPVDWSVFRPILLFGQAAKNPRTQYAEQYNLTIQREVVRNMVLQLSYVGRQGHRLLASQDLNPGNPQTCLDLNTILGVGTCGPFFADSAFSFDLPAGSVFHLPYAPGPTPGGPNIPCPLVNAPPACTRTGAPGGTPINLVGLRPYSSPLCDPIGNTGCPPDGIDVFSSIFTQNTIANSSYNAFQASLEKRFSHGLQFQASYTFGKSIDMASTFENLIDPVNPKRDRALSLFDARHRFVFSYYWELPVPKYEGFKGKALNGWALSGITTFQSGFPIRITSQDDTELQSSFDFETPGEPNLLAPFKKLNPRGPGNLGFDPSSFSTGCIDPADTSNLQALCSNDPGGVVLGTIGNAPRTICCGPGINNWEIGFQKVTPLTERTRLEFRGELFNAFNHAQFFQPDGNTTDGADFGRVKRARDPRLVQFALKLYF